MAKLSKEQVEHIALLSRLSLSSAEISKFQSELSAILAYVGKLGEVDTKGVPGTASASGLVNVMREDAAEKCEIPREKLLEGAPDKKEGFLKTKAILE